MLEQLLEQRHTAMVEWAEPHPACGPEGNDLNAYVVLRATVHDCINMRRLVVRNAGMSPMGNDARWLSEFIDINGAALVKDTFTTEATDGEA